VGPTQLGPKDKASLSLDTSNEHQEVSFILKGSHMPIFRQNIWEWHQAHQKAAYIEADRKVPVLSDFIKCAKTNLNLLKQFL
jgi:hypothetical protein